MRRCITMGELTDTAAAGILAKYVLILYAVQAVLGGAVGVYLGVRYTDEIIEAAAVWRNQ